MIKGNMQPQEDPKVKILPAFRSELTLYRGPNSVSGAPTYNLFDPVKSKYYKISWEQSLIFEFAKLGVNAEDLSKEISKNTTLNVTADEVLSFYTYLSRYGLLKQNRSSDSLLEEVQKGKVHPFKWLIFHYLYIRIPLFNPDRFLSRTLHLVTPLASKFALSIFAIMSFLGIAMLIPRFGEYLATFPYFFNFEGFVTFVGALFFVKIIHEFAHAYTAKHYGIYVPTMGIVFLVLYPAMYTDVTHGWQLKSRRARFSISAAGVCSELIMAGLALFGWALVPPGKLQSVFFVISSSSLLTSLLVNLNPAMRFDGYYLLSDLWGIDNLQSRGFAAAKWKLRSWFLGFKMPPPEPNLTERRAIGFVVYSVYTWIYRLFLYTAIALFVYLKFTKSLGVLLFFLEVLVFFVWPVIWEVQELSKLRQYFTKNPRILATSTVLAIAFAYFVLPLPHRLNFSGVTAPQDEQLIYSSEPGVIRSVLVKKGDSVTEGELLVDLNSEPLKRALAKESLEVKIVEAEAKIIREQEELRSLLGKNYSERLAETERLKAYQERVNDLQVKSHLNGTVQQWDDTLREGVFVQADQIFGRVVDPKHVLVFFYVPEKDIEALEVDQEVTFTVQHPRETFNAVITKINTIASETLIYETLSSDFEGELATMKDQSGALNLLDSYYKVEASLAEPSGIRLGLSGEIGADGPWRSYLAELWKYVLSVLTRESGA